jgi:hypothetical protein
MNGWFATAPPGRHGYLPGIAHQGSGSDIPFGEAMQVVIHMSFLNRSIRAAGTHWAARRITARNTIAISEIRRIPSY